MKYSLAKNIYWIIILFITGSCVKEYDPPVNSAGGYLVVNGYLDIEKGACTIQLTRSKALSNNAKPKREKDAQVSIEEESGISYKLSSIDSGVYVTVGLSLKYGSKYRLKIKTTDNKEYVSDFVSSLHAPPAIDNVQITGGFDSWKINVNTHDPANNTWYYRWEFTETWEYVSGIKSKFVFDFGRDTVVPRQDDIYHCWKSQNSTEILIGSSKKLSQDIISDFTLTTLDAYSYKINIEYSILVKQYAISKEEYDYWQMLRKNTETNGSIFDPQPSQVTGNIHSTADSQEPVFGFFSATTVVEKRKTQKLADFNAGQISPPPSCELDTTFRESIKLFAGRFLLIDEVWETGRFVGYTMGTPNCVDCRSRIYGGTNVKPDFMGKK